MSSTNGSVGTKLGFVLTWAGVRPESNKAHTLAAFDSGLTPAQVKTNPSLVPTLPFVEDMWKRWHQAWICLDLGRRQTRIKQSPHLSCVLFPSDSRLRILEILQGRIDIAFHEQAVREAPGIADLQSHLAGNFASEAGGENVGVRGLQVR